MKMWVSSPEFKRFKLINLNIDFLVKEEEAYVCIYSERQGDVILFHHQGGVDIGNVDEKASRLDVQVGAQLSMDDIIRSLLVELDPSKQE